eukprot:TRINITY_DN16231_c1_g4_i1.p1 TRINITY_DN16231_c1_g4~~TRINITY_DN16231_c1_g4_i1.p1  ORF type:complete len:960 (+),score=323.61 TRINITY_DN16231_c1_g4_i1:35-2881(+)
MPDLRKVEGVWRDKLGSVYEVTLDGSSSASVATTRRNGEQRFTTALIRVGADGDITWSSSYKLAFVDKDSLTWKPAFGGRTDFVWTRCRSSEKKQEQKQEKKQEKKPEQKPEQRQEQRQEQKQDQLLQPQQRQNRWKAVSKAEPVLELNVSSSSFGGGGGAWSAAPTFPGAAWSMSSFNFGPSVGGDAAAAAAAQQMQWRMAAAAASQAAATAANNGMLQPGSVHTFTMFVPNASASPDFNALSLEPGSVSGKKVHKLENLRMSDAIADRASASAITDGAPAAAAPSTSPPPAAAAPLDASPAPPPAAAPPAVSPAAAEAPAHIALELNTRVSALFHGSWHFAKVRRLLENGLIEVLWDEDGCVTELPRCAIVPLEPTSAPRSAFVIGDQVTAKFYGEWHAASVRRILPGDIIEVLWSEENSVSALPAADVRLSTGCAPPPGVSDGQAAGEPPPPPPPRRAPAAEQQIQQQSQPQSQSHSQSQSQPQSQPKPQTQLQPQTPSQLQAQTPSAQLEPQSPSWWTPDVAAKALAKDFPALPAAASAASSSAATVRARQPLAKEQSAPQESIEESQQIGSALQESPAAAADASSDAESSSSSSSGGDLALGVIDLSSPSKQAAPATPALSAAPAALAGTEARRSRAERKREARQRLEEDLHSLREAKPSAGTAAHDSEAVKPPRRKKPSARTQSQPKAKAKAKPKAKRSKRAAVSEAEPAALEEAPLPAAAKEAAEEEEEEGMPCRLCGAKALSEEESRDGAELFLCGKHLRKLIQLAEKLDKWAMQAKGRSSALRELGSKHTKDWCIEHFQKIGFVDALVDLLLRNERSPPCKLEKEYIGSCLHLTYTEYAALSTLAKGRKEKGALAGSLGKQVLLGLKGMRNLVRVLAARWKDKNGTAGLPPRAQNLAEDAEWMLEDDCSSGGDWSGDYEDDEEEEEEEKEEEEEEEEEK